MSDLVHHVPVPLAEKPDFACVWTFLIVGGEWLTATLPNHPRLEHLGRTVWKMYGTEAEMAIVKDTLTEHLRGGTVEVLTETQSVEQMAERLLTTGHSGR